MRTTRPTGWRSRGWRSWAAGLWTALAGGVLVAGLLAGETTERDRVREITTRLRCPVCQAESVAESPSQTSREMTALVAEQVRAGRDDAQILAFFRLRYGDWILLDPPTSGETLLVWLLPPLALVAGVVLVLARGRREAPVVLSPRVQAAVAAERRRVARDAQSPNPVEW